MINKYIFSVLYLIFVLFFVGCHTSGKVGGKILDRDILNQFTLEDHVFESAHIVEVLDYVESNINRQSDEEWVIVINQDEGNIRSIGDDELRHWFKFSGTVISKVGVGDFFEFLTTRTFTEYKVEGTVITFSRKIH